MGIIAGFVTASAGYLALGFSPTLWAACAAVVLAHSGGSTSWVFSTTLLQLQTEDRFRGRVFSAEFSFNVVTLSAATYTAGWLTDSGWPVYSVAKLTGVVILVPAILWASVQRLWREPG